MYEFMTGPFSTDYIKELKWLPLNHPQLLVTALTNPLSFVGKIFGLL